MFTTLLDRIDITDAVITADALHAQRDHATYLAGRSAHYLLIVKRNQPGLHAQLAALPWRDVPVAYDQARERGHGRTERRTLKVTAVAKGLAFPHAAQAIQIVRRRKVKGKWSARNLLRRHLADRHPGQPTPSSRPSSAATGASKTACTGSATWTSTKTAPRSAPPAAHASWPACATWPSPSCGWPARPASPPPCATTPGSPADHSGRSWWRRRHGSALFPSLRRVVLTAYCWPCCCQFASRPKLLGAHRLPTGSYSASVSGLLWRGLRMRLSGCRVRVPAGIQGWPLKRPRRASSLAMPHFVAVER